MAEATVAIKTVEVTTRTEVPVYNLALSEAEAQTLRSLFHYCIGGHEERSWRKHITSIVGALSGAGLRPHPLPYHVLNNVIYADDNPA